MANDNLPPFQARYRLIRPGQNREIIGIFAELEIAYVAMDGFYRRFGHCAQIEFLVQIGGRWEWLNDEQHGEYCDEVAEAEEEAARLQALEAKWAAEDAAPQAAWDAEDLARGCEQELQAAVAELVEAAVEVVARGSLSPKGSGLDRRILTNS